MSLWGYQKRRRQIKSQGLSHILHLFQQKSHIQRRRSTFLRSVNEIEGDNYSVKAQRSGEVPYTRLIAECVVCEAHDLLNTELLRLHRLPEGEHSSLRHLDVHSKEQKL